ncbi:MAG: (Fe-S)-binding protein, partial [Elusimicrobia bacterium]|nr:(Fe-S)-binding protein [Elusimicrobiota bacterium]
MSDSTGGKMVLLDDLALERVRRATGGAADICFQCGSCTASCPWGLVRKEPFSVRRIVRGAQLGLQEAREAVWLCTTCGACESRCPRGVPVSRVMLGLRELDWMERKAPKGLPNLLWSLYWDGNPYRRPPSERSLWGKGLQIPPYDPARHEILLYIGCTGSYDRRVQKVAGSLIRLFKMADVRFGTLGDQEPCCGESALSLGQKSYFEQMAQSNMKLFKERKVSTLVALSPHCWDVFKNHMPRPDAGFRPLHYTQYLAELLDSGRIRFRQKLSSRVAFHDPCYLGRRNGEYEAPRRVLRGVPGLELVELPRNREGGLCCGGGGGRMYLETAAKERFSNLRVREAAELGVEAIVTACPF